MLSLASSSPGSRRSFRGAAFAVLQLLFVQLAAANWFYPNGGSTASPTSTAVVWLGLTRSELIFVGTGVFLGLLFSCGGFAIVIFFILRYNDNDNTNNNNSNDDKGKEKGAAAAAASTASPNSTSLAPASEPDSAASSSGSPPPPTQKQSVVSEEIPTKDSARDGLRLRRK